MRRCKQCRRSVWEVWIAPRRWFCKDCRTLRKLWIGIWNRLYQSRAYSHLSLLGVEASADEFCRQHLDEMKEYWKKWGDEPPSIHRPDPNKTYTSDNIQIIPKRLNSSWTRRRALSREDARRVRNLRESGKTVTAIALEFQTSIRCISDCCTGRLYVVEDQLAGGLDSP